VEGGQQARLSAGDFRSRLMGASVAGALLAGLGTLAAGMLLRGGAPAGALWLARFIAGGGGLALLLWGAAAGALISIRWARSRRETLAATLTAGLALLLGWAAFGPGDTPSRRAPLSARAKVREIRRNSYRSAESVAQIVPYARDPDPLVREHAVLALGVNLVVDDFEKATQERPPRLAADPVRDRIRSALLAALADSVEAVRAEAARALWKAPRSFGRQPAAAETLAAILDRALHSAAPERLSWLALDAAAGAPHPALKSAAARFAAATPDSELARAARKAAAR
jgi:hypothetical protein